MSIKEFSQKNGQTFFYASIVLLIISIVLGVSLCCKSGQPGKSGPRNFDGQMRNNGGMMQNNDIRPNTNKKLNNSNVNQNVTDQGVPSTNDTSAPITPTMTPTVQ